MMTERGVCGSATPSKNSDSGSGIYIGGNRSLSFWPPKIVWSRQRGWLNVRDPETGQWFGIPAKEAPSGWARIATAAKRER
jgi:hypothetical protein